MVTQRGTGAVDAPLFITFRGKTYLMGEKESLTVPGRYDEIRRICEFVADGAERAGFDEDAVFQVQLACDEACTNIIEHTYKDEDVGDITIDWEIGPQKFTITIQDNGQPFDTSDIPPAPVPAGPLPADADEEYELKIGGLGVFFMRELMDSVEFSYNQGSGNVLTMEKRRPDAQE